MKLSQKKFKLVTYFLILFFLVIVASGCGGGGSSSGDDSNNNDNSNTTEVPANVSTAVLKKVIEPGEVCNIEVTGIDNIPPVVTETTPRDNLVNIPVESVVNVTFNEGMEPDSITAGTFVVNNGSTNIAGTVSYDPDSRTATFTPMQNFQYLTVYTATIASDATDALGNGLAANYTFTFTTQQSIVVIPPAVESVFPEQGNNTIDIISNVTACFNKTLDGATVNNATITVTTGGTTVAGTVTYRNMIAAFDPVTDLAYSTTYTVTLTTGVKDLDGVPMTTNETWSFTTRPTATLKVPSKVASGNNFSCGIINLEAKCWGTNVFG